MLREEGQQLGEALLQPRLLGLDLPDLPSAAITQIMQHPDGPTRKVADACTKMHCIVDAMQMTYPVIPVVVCLSPRIISSQSCSGQLAADACAGTKPSFWPIQTV